MTFSLHLQFVLHKRFGKIKKLLTLCKNHIMGKVKTNILLVEDDVNLGYILKDYLEMSDYQVELCRNGAQGAEMFKKQGAIFDLCILDVMMPDKDGFTLAEEIRISDPNIPIIFLSAKSMKEDKIRGLKIGADDYITKPFSSEELILRIEAILRRYKHSYAGDGKKSTYHIGNYTFDYANQLLTSDKTEKSLTKREADVLRVLCLNKNKLVRREEALHSIWGESDYFKGRSMDVYITKLRKYLQDDSKIHITNIHGTGFKLEIDN